MRNFLNIINRKLTIGNLSSIIASLVFAIILRHVYLHLLEYWPVKGKLESLDISYFALVAVFKFIITAFLEHLLHEKISIPLFQGVELSKTTTLSMVNSDKSPSPESSPKGKYASVKQKVDRFVENARPSVKQVIEENRKFIEEKFNTSHKMWNVLMEQSEKILKLHSIKSDKDVKFYQENGGLELSVSNNMTDANAEKLSKEVGALDRAIKKKNKFSKYQNLLKKDARLYDSQLAPAYNDMCSINQKQYKDLFETEEKKRNKKKLFFFFLVYLHIGRGFSLNYATLYYLLYTLYFQTKTIRKKKVI